MFFVVANDGIIEFLPSQAVVGIVIYEENIKIWKIFHVFSTIVCVLFVCRWGDTQIREMASKPGEQSRISLVELYFVFWFDLPVTNQ